MSNDDPSRFRPLPLFTARHRTLWGGLTDTTNYNRADQLWRKRELIKDLSTICVSLSASPPHQRLAISHPPHNFIKL